MNKKILLLALVSSSALFAGTVTGSVEGSNLTTTTLKKESTTQVGQKLAINLGLKEYGISLGTDLYSNLTNKGKFSDKSLAVNNPNYIPLKPTAGDLWIKYSNTFENGIKIDGKATINLDKTTSLEGGISGNIATGTLGENLKLDYTYGKDNAKLTSTTSYDTGNQISDKTSLNAKVVFDNNFRQKNAGFNKFAVTFGGKTSAIENTTIESTLTATGFLTPNNGGVKDLKVNAATKGLSNLNVAYNLKANYAPATYYIKPSIDLGYYHLVAEPKAAPVVSTSSDSAPAVEAAVLGNVVTEKVALEGGYTGIENTKLSTTATITSQQYVDSADTPKSQNYVDLKLEPKAVMTHYKTDKVSVGTEMDGSLEYNVLKSYDTGTKQVSKFENSNVKLGFTPQLNIEATPTAGLTITGNVSIPFSLAIPFTPASDTSNVATRGTVAPSASLNTTIGLKYVW